MIVEHELRGEVARCLSGAITPSDLYRWVLSRGWNMHKDSSEAARELAGAVELVFFEREAAHTDDDVRKSLAVLVAGGGEQP